MFATIFTAYVLLWITETILLDAMGQHWFFKIVVQGILWTAHCTPSPMVAWRRQIVWEAVYGQHRHTTWIGTRFIDCITFDAAAVKKILPSNLPTAS
jgi:hypothetical protein